MTVAQKVSHVVKKLPASKQKQVLAFAVSLENRAQSAKRIPARKRDVGDPLELTKLGRLVKRLRLSKTPNLPADFASQVDHYAYGVAKR